MLFYCGIDLHARESVLCIIDAQDTIHFRDKVPNQLSHILEILHSFTPKPKVALEATLNWYWLVDGLMDQGFSLHLANPAAMKQYEGLKYTDDNSDAAWLANTLRLGILPEGYIYPREEHMLRDLLRKRLQLVH